jgi:hypothetical protein
MFHSAVAVPLGGRTLGLWAVARIPDGVLVARANMRVVLVSMVKVFQVSNWQMYVEIQNLHYKVPLPLDRGKFDLDIMRPDKPLLVQIPLLTRILEFNLCAH